MRDLCSPAIETYRVRTREVRNLYGSYGDAGNGVFDIPFPRTGVMLRCIASNGGDWEHVSVSLPNRCPNWPEMEFIKRMLFKDDETAMQLHVPVRDHINVHPHCLHLWRPTTCEIPRPPGEFVG